MKIIIIERQLTTKDFEEEIKEVMTDDNKVV